MQRMTLKPGETFVIDAIASDGALPIDLTGYVIRSQVRDLSDALMMDVSVTIDADQVNHRGRHVLDFDRTITKNWTPSEAVCNVRYEKDGVVFSTETFGIHISAPGVTR